MCARLLPAATGSVAGSVSDCASGNPEHSPLHSEVNITHYCQFTFLIPEFQGNNSFGWLCLEHFRLDGVPGRHQQPPEEGPGRVPHVPLLPGHGLDGDIPH